MDTKSQPARTLSAPTITPPTSTNPPAMNVELAASATSTPLKPVGNIEWQETNPVACPVNPTSPAPEPVPLPNKAKAVKPNSSFIASPSTAPSLPKSGPSLVPASRPPVKLTGTTGVITGSTKAVRPIPTRPADPITHPMTMPVSHPTAPPRLGHRSTAPCRPSGQFPITKRTVGKRRLRQCCIDAQRQAAKISRLSSDARARSGAAAQRMLGAQRPTTTPTTGAVPAREVVKKESHVVQGTTATPGRTTGKPEASLVKPITSVSAQVVKREAQPIAGNTAANVHAGKEQAKAVGTGHPVRQSSPEKPINLASSKVVSVKVVVKREPQPVAAKTSELANVPARSNKQVTAVSAPSTAIGARNVSGEARMSATPANVSTLPRGSGRPAAVCACPACILRRAQLSQGPSGMRRTALPRPSTPSLSTGTNVASKAGPPGTQKVPVVPPGALAAAARAAAAVEPTPPLQPRTSSGTSTSQAPPSTPIRRTAPKSTAAIKPKPVIAKVGAPSRAIAGHVSSTTQAPVSTAIPASGPAVPECASPVTAAQNPVGATHLAPSAEMAPPRTFPDDAHVTMWNREEQRKIAGNAAPLGKNVERYLKRHPECETYVNQDHGRVTRRCDRSDRKKQRVNPAELGAGVHVSIWNRKDSRKVAGNAAPLNKNLTAYLAKHPHCEVYNGQDDVSTIKEEKVINPVELDAVPESDSNVAAPTDGGPKEVTPTEAAPKESSPKPAPPAEAEGGLDAWKKLYSSGDALDPLFKTEFELADEWVQGDRSGEDRISPMVVESNVGNDLSTMVLDIQDVVPLDQEMDSAADDCDPFAFFNSSDLPPLEF